MLKLNLCELLLSIEIDSFNKQCKHSSNIRGHEMFPLKPERAQTKLGFLFLYQSKVGHVQICNEYYFIYFFSFSFL